MPYCGTIEEDIERAKRILAEGEARPNGIHAGCTIYGKDIYAAYKLLESFVQAIEESLVQQRALADTFKSLAYDYTENVHALRVQNHRLIKRVQRLEQALNPHDIPPED